MVRLPNLVVPVTVTNRATDRIDPRDAVLRCSEHVCPGRWLRREFVVLFTVGALIDFPVPSSKPRRRCSPFCDLDWMS